ncbi:MAG: 16S rRNA (cytosine(1402)-N(4))-methyltransferase RsmH [Treponema sp.]|jgi:16S rRNA (cytosine1402-N4)-methyltransferase|nr:16S rRNA (cytosine(1402)-N(4))-methyltransferase RsmH [Treponema sp.]
MEVIHTPVLREETIRYLGPRNEGELMLDATTGEGGHSEAFLSAFPHLRMICVDADPEILKTAIERHKIFGGRVQFFNDWAQNIFAEYPASLKRPDTILIDLGVSYFHYEKSGRGFSFRYDEPLDMRIDTSSGLTAADFIARLSEKELADMFYVNAGERYSRRIAKAVVEARANGPVTSSAVLADIVERSVPPSYSRTHVHPATKVFMALRIAVNCELSRLPDLLEGALRLLEPGGRMGVISFNSAEDRIVKLFFREKNKDCLCPPDDPICRCGGNRLVNLLSRKGVTPSDEEIRMNPPSRSARLRVVEKILDEAES